MSKDREPPGAVAARPERRAARIHAAEAFVDPDLLTPLQDRLDRVATEYPELVAHIARLTKGASER